MAGMQMPHTGSVPNVEVLTGQIIQLTETIESMRSEMHGMNGEINRLQRRGREENRDEKKKDEDIVDRKFFTPEAFSNGSVLREWKTEFEDYINGRDKELGALFEKSEQAKEVIVGVGDNERAIDRAQELYRIIWKLATQPEAKSIVTHVPNNNLGEALRLLAARCDPKNDAFNAKSVRDPINVKVWEAKMMHELPPGSPSGSTCRRST